MPQAGIDMNLIREAIMRRQNGDIQTPAAGQVTLPGGATPGGGPNTPIPAAPNPSMPAQATGAPMTGATMPAGASPNINAGLQAGQALKENPRVDDETKLISKALIAKLLKLL